MITSHAQALVPLNTLRAGTQFRYQLSSPIVHTLRGFEKRQAIESDQYGNICSISSTQCVYVEESRGDN